MPAGFDCFHAVPASVSKTCLVRFDNNKYSVAARAVGRPVEIQAYADRIVIRQDGRIVAEHPRSFGRGETTYDPWHYVPVLARKPGALRNGAPFKDWVLPAAIERIRRRLASTDDGNRQMVDILNAVLTDGLPAVEAACAEALGHGVHSADVVLNIQARQREPAPTAKIMTPAALTLRHAPIADCARYDSTSPTHVGSNGPPAVRYCFFAGAPGSTAATPSGLMLKAKNINGSLPGFPHWCTRAYGS